MFLCASPHRHRVCVVFPFSLRLPYPLCTRFCFLCLCASPLKRRVCVVLLISLWLPCPVCTRFIYHVLCASPHYYRFCAASLFSSPALRSSLFILSVCFAPKTVQFYFPWDFCSLMRLLAFTVIFSVSFTLSKLLRFRAVFVPISALQFCMLCLFCFSFMLYSVFPAFFSSQRVFAGFVTFCLQPSFASQTMALCRVFLATSSSSFVFIWPCCFQRYFVFPALPHFLAIVSSYSLETHSLFSRVFSICVSCLPNLFV